MKKTWILFAVAIFLIAVSCNGQSRQGQKESPVAAVESTVSQSSRVDQNNGSLQKLTKADFLRLVMDYEKNPEIWKYKGDRPCLVDFYAEWCGPCKISSPILEELAREYSGKINIYKIDIDDEQELASVFGVQSIPTFLYCPLAGNPTLSSGIANTPEATRDMFRQQIERILLNKGNTPL